MKKKLTAILLGMLMSATLFSVNVSALEGLALSDKYNVEYRTHVQDYGWETTWRSNGSLSGTVGESKRLEALEVKLTGAGLPVGAAIQTYVHVQNEGDLGPFAMGKMAGTEGKGQRLERITMNLINLPDHQLRYNVQVQNIGWLRDENDVSTWFVGGESAGTSGRGLRLEGIKIALIETNEAYEAYEKALAAVKEENYTTSSWQYYQALVEIYAVTADNTKAEIEEATKEVQAAQKDLVKASDMSVYKAVLASVKEADYTPESWQAYQQVVSDNYVTKDDSQTVINAAIKKIQEAQKLLQRKINLTEYFEVIGSALESDYMPESWAEYQQVLAQNVVTAANSQTEINAAVKNIIEAQKKMVRRLDFTGYNGLLKAVKEEDYTTESWLIYQDVVNANVMTENNTQSEVAKAMESIEAAQKKLVKNADLSAYDAALIAVLEDDYTPASWLIYQNVVKANKVTAANGQVAIDAATQKILDAQLKLVKKGDFTAYEAALAAVNPDDYTPLSWATYQKVVTANRASGAATQDTIDKATDKILVAQLNLVKKGDMTNYKNALDAVKETNYTGASWTEYQKVVKANPVTINSTQEVIDLATENIISAQDKLEFKNGDIRAYETALTKVKEADYTNASWKIYQKVVQANVVDGENKQTEIDQATKNIQAAQGTLVRKGSLTEYNIALAGLDEADYTAVSWKAYQNVVKANIRTSEDTQAVIDLSTTKILAAQKSLVKVGDLTAYEAALAAVRKENYTTATWNDYQLVVKANVRTKNEAQLVIDGSVKKILAAQKLLVRKYDISAYNALLAAVKQADYIPVSWTAYQTVVKAYPASYSPIQTAIEKIEAAQAKLVKKVDLTAYKKALAAVKEAEYVPATWVAYMKVVNANVVDETNTQTQIDEATKKIIEAQKELKRKVNLTLYLELLEGVIEYDYSPTSWVIYQKVLADNVVTENNTQTEVDAATEKIRVAQNKLVRRLDYTRYQELVDAMKDKQDQYTSVSWGLYDKVIKDNTLKKDQSETQTQIDKAVANIEAAQKKLVKAGDLTAYNLVLAAVKREDYTTASWDVYLKVLEANEMSKNHSQAEIDVATDKIRLAQLKLAKGGSTADYDALLKLAPDPYTSASWEIYKKVVEANFVTKADGQAKINAAVAKIAEAQRKLVLRGKLDLPNGYNETIAAKEEINFTSKSWEIYKKVREANVMDADKSQAQIDAAVAAIKKAQLSLVAAGKMAPFSAVIKEYEDKKETFTSKSWKLYQDVVNKNWMTSDNSDAEIKSAVDKITKAQRELLVVRVIEADFKIYEDAFNLKKETDYTAASWKLFKPILIKNIMTRDSSKEEVQAAIKNIEAAYFLLVDKGDINLFETYETVRKARNNQEQFYQTAFWDTYLKALAANVVTRDNTDDEIKKATVAIEDAQAVLETGKVDLYFYQKVLDQVIQDDYTKESWAIYWQVVLANHMTRDNTKDEVEAATATIAAAQKDLEGAGALNNFLAAIELYQINFRSVDGDEISNNTDPTGDSWDQYVNIVKKYASFIEDESKRTCEWNNRGDGIDDVTSKMTQSQIDAITGMINEKRQAIKLATANQAAYDAYLVARTPEYGKDYYTNNSYANFEAVVTEPQNIITEPVLLEVERKNNIDGINDITKRINEAKELLTKKADTTAFDEQMLFYDNKISSNCMIRDLNGYIQDQSEYVIGGWGNFENLIIQYRYDPNSHLYLDPNNSSQDAYDQASIALKVARAALVEVTKQTGTELQLPTISSDYKSLGTLPVVNTKYGTVITWISNNQGRLTNEGVWQAGAEDTVELEATIKDTHTFGLSYTVKYEVKVNNTGIISINPMITAVTVAGTTTVGSTLTAVPTPTAATVSYQWERADSGGTFENISGANAQTYTLVADDLNKSIRVTVTGTGNYLGSGSVSSTPSSLVKGANIATLTAGTLAGQNLVGTFTGGSDIGGSSPLTVSVATANKTNATLALTKGNAGATVKYVKKTGPAPANDADYTVDFASTPAIAEDLATNEVIWLLVTAQDGTTKKYYKITVTVNP